MENIEKDIAEEEDFSGDLRAVIHANVFLSSRLSDLYPGNVLDQLEENYLFSMGNESSFSEPQRPTPVDFERANQPINRGNDVVLLSPPLVNQPINRGDDVVLLSPSLVNRSDVRRRPSAVKKHEILADMERKSERPTKIDQLEIHPRILAILLKMKLKSVRELLDVSPIALRHASLTGPEVERLLLETSKKWWSPNLDLFSVARSRAAPTIRLTFGCPLLDKLFRGGIVVDHLTEFAGAAGTAKTQTCLFLALRAQLPVLSGGLGGEVLYLCTETVPIRRLRQMTDEMVRNLTAAKSEVTPSMDRIFIENLVTLDEVEHFLSGRVHDLLTRLPIKLVIVDSMASVFRYQEEEKVNSMERSARLQRMTVILRRLQAKYNVALICTNQATTMIDDAASSDTLGDGVDRTAPALGLSWSNFVTTRVMLHKTRMEDPDTGLAVVKRRMKVVFAPHLPQTQVKFEVGMGGLRGVGKVEVSF